MKFISLIITIALFFLLGKMKEKNISFAKRVILAAILGLALGYFFAGSTEYVAIFGKVFIRLLSAMVIPLLFATIIRTTLNTGSLGKLRSVGLKSVGILSLHNVLGSTIGLILAVVFSIGKGASIPLPEGNEVKEVPTVAETITNFFPSNIISNAGDGMVIPVIIFSILVAIAALKLVDKGEGEKVTAFKDFINSFAEIIYQLTSMITSLTPFAVLSLMAEAVSRIDYEAVKPLLLILVLNYVASAIHSFITTGALVSVFAKVNPVKYFKNAWPAQVVGFTTQSSMGSLPVNMENLEKTQGVSEDIASFVAPLGATMGMPGCAGFWPVMNAVLTINVMGLDFGGFDYVKLILIALLVSLGTVGVPGTATIATTAVFAAMGLPLEMVVLLAPISSLADMGRTSTNVVAANSSALIVAASEGKLNREVFNS